MIKNINDPRQEVQVCTPKGRVRGFKWRNTYHFLGLKYGTAKRWQRAEPLEPWKGIMNCMYFGDVCPTFSGYKPIDGNFVPRMMFAKSEDCLNLNIWTQSIEKGVKKPVLFWIHGGGFADGSSMTMNCYDGEGISDYGDIVFVSVDQRLNMFGYLDVSDRGSEYQYSGVLGMTDIVLALKWVQENISCFGGDPNNVTIVGQSGGGGKVTALLQIPEADGLYHKAIVQSGIRTVQERQVDKAFSDELVRAMMKKLGTEDFQDLVHLQTDELVALAESVHEEIEEKCFNLGTWGPIENDWFTGYAIRDGFTEYGKTVPMIVGSNLAEMGVHSIPNKNHYTEQEREEIVRQVCGSQDAQPLIDAYRKAWPGKNIIECLFADGGYRIATLQYLKNRIRDCSAPTYDYIFAMEFPYNGGNLAWHCAEIPFVFKNVDQYPEFYKLGETANRLELQMTNAWLSFLRTGNPNHDCLEPKWPAYTADHHATYVFDEKCVVREGDFDKELIDLYSTYDLPRPRPGKVAKYYHE